MPPPPRLWRVLREAVSDFYFHAWPFLGANLVLGALGIGLLIGSLASPWGMAIVVLLVLPAAGIMRMATRLMRDFHTDLGDFAEVARRPWPILGIGLAQIAITVVLLVDILIAAAWRAWPGTILLVGALYALLVLWVYALVAWPLLLDPERDAEGIRSRLRLALLVLLAYPLRVGLFAMLIGALLLFATVAIAPIITFAIGLAWLAIARYVLPIADRIEGRETLAVD